VSAVSHRVSLLVFAVIAPTAASAQGVSVDVAAGRMIYDRVSANVSTNNVMGTLRYDARRDAWVYGTAAAPLRTGDPVWGSFGAGGRFLPSGGERRRVNVGLDLSGEGYMFRDAKVDQTGRGAGIDALPFVRFSSGAAGVELRGGWRGHTLTYLGTTEHRGVFETGARASYGVSVRVEGDARWVRATEGTYPFVGATLQYGGVPMQAWVQAGRWLGTELDDLGWGAGIGVALGTHATLWANARQETPDPLYWNVARRSWSVGVTRRLGRRTPGVLPVPRQEDGGILIRVSASDAPGAELSIAGDFSTWRPMPMRREGDAWVIRLPLSPGLYHYAFRSASGNWFVPASIAGRRPDGMGGYVAVLVVS
jgi:hypothetical protein